MTLTLKTKISQLLILGLFFLIAPSITNSQGALTLSVSPTLFKMSASPTQDLDSTVKIINSNKFDIEVYADVVNFEPQGESGQVKFLPVNIFESNGQTLAEWISLEKKEFTIPAEQAIQIPFKISLPEDTPPGSHSAAILVGTKSMGSDDKKMKVETSQVVTSLIFLRVAGDVVEDGSIREFRTSESVYESPTATFELRFENKGNVNIQPQGDIKILNMWGNERGVIPVNRQTLFGDVIRESIRKYTFTWSGDWSLADMGRYTAVATLAYGEDGRKFASSETAFWVIPWKVLGIVLLVLIGFISLVSWAIKLYVRKMLMIAGVSPELHSMKHRSVAVSSRQVSVVAPIEAGMLDLRYRIKNSNTLFSKLSSVAQFINNYKLFFMVVIAVIIFIVAIILYIKSASVSERGYEVTVDGIGSDVTISSEQMKYDELSRTATGVNQNVNVKEFPPIKIVNQSGINGVAAKLRLDLESKGYTVKELTNEFGATKINTVIVYAPEYDEEALELSRDISGSLLSAFPEASNTDTPIIVYVGKDLENDVQ